MKLSIFSLRLIALKLTLGLLVAFAHQLSAAEAATSQSNLYPKVAAIFAEHCLDCHGVQDPDGKLILETYELMLKGGESGPAFVPGKSSESLLIKMVEGKTEKDGKPHFMPPGKRKKLSEAEVAVLKQWVDAGAPPPAQEVAREVVIPKITPKFPPVSPVNAIAYSFQRKIIAAARDGVVEIISEESQDVVKRFTGFPGMINAVVFSPDGATVFAAGGRSGLSGEVYRYNLDDPSDKPAQIYSKHPDAIYSLAISPDGKLLATGSYDQKIKLWDVVTAKETKTLSGHNGAVYGLAFRNDGKLLASASGDRTVKLWDVQSGERRDTLSQSLKELYTVAFSPDGKRLIAGGSDNRIRQWEISEKAAETTNPLLISKFGHEGTILKLTYSADGKTVASSADDRTVKFFKADDLQEISSLEKQEDWAPALAFITGDKGLAAGRINGTIQFYNVANGSKMVPPAPSIASIEPRGAKVGSPTKIKLSGKNLSSVKEVKFDNAALMAKILESTNSNNGTETFIEVRSSEELPRGMYEFSVVGKGGSSPKFKLYLDNIPQLTEAGLDKGTIPSLPASVWATHETSGDEDRFSFEAKAGRTLVFDAAARSLGSKASLVMTLTDAEGKVLASNNSFDKSADPLIAHKFEKDGLYHLTMTELLPGGSAEHFYRLDIGEFPYVTSIHPNVIAKGQSTPVRYVGFNLPENAAAPQTHPHAGDVQVEADAKQFRSRGSFKLKVSDFPTVEENEPNNTAANATSIQVPGAGAGRIFSAEGSRDEDWFRFECRKGQSLVIETTAAQLNSPTDTRIEVLDTKGQPVVRTLLQATRDSAITFRGIDSTTVDCRVDNWEEMELNQYLYLQGEVVRLFRMPQGPDSGFNFYALNGRRRNYFDTTSTAHPNAEPCYIVEPRAPGSKLISNGLPVFALNYENDDDAEKRVGTDSRLYFTPRADGTYHVRVTDTRNFSGDRFTYALTIREARPDFKVVLNGANPTVPAGSGQSFNVSVDRIDGFDEEIVVDITGVPTGFVVSTPLVIQAGHQSAHGTVWAAPGAADMTDDLAAKIKVTARAKMGSNEMLRDVNSLGKIKVGSKPALFVSLQPEGQTNAAASSEIPEITIAPGQTVPAWLKVTRNGHTELMTFSVENLPHGVIVDNIGLNGVLIPKDQSDREIFLNAARWVPETDRLCFAVCNEAGRQTSRPVMLKVRKQATKPSVATK